MSSAKRVAAVSLITLGCLFFANPQSVSAQSISVGQGSPASSEYVKAFQRIGGSSRIGNPINSVHGWNAGCIQDFRGGLSGEAAIMQANCRGPAYSVIYGQWKYIVRTWGGNATNVIGYPINDAYRNGAGWYQNFVGGSWGRTVIARPDSTKIEKSVRGNILTYWLANGGATGRFRYPLTDSYPNNGGHRQDFEGGSIFWSASTGSVTVQPPQPVISREQKALNWVVAEKNSPNPSWSDEFGRPWSGYCEGFTEVAFGTRNQFTSALNHYYWQLNNGRIRTDTNPPAGAIVFYAGGSYGHVGISIGNSQVISTQGYDGQYLPVWQHHVTGLSNKYLGWAYAPAHWPGR
jgi:hypothetical protein